MSYNEFLDWVEYLRWCEDRTTKDQYFLAQIAAEMRRTIVKNPKDVKLQDFILKWERPGEVEAEDKSPEQKLAQSKGAWLGALKPTGRKKKKRNGPT